MRKRHLSPKASGLARQGVEAPPGAEVPGAIFRVIPDDEPFVVRAEGDEDGGMCWHLVNDIGAGHVPDLHVVTAGTSVPPRPSSGEPGIRAQREINVARGWRQSL